MLFVWKWKKWKKKVFKNLWKTVGKSMEKLSGFPHFFVCSVLVVENGVVFPLSHTYLLTNGV